ncbi:glycoside hydrolase superfamily [Aspergillus avenaceus]|uniref:Glycoside hydrolase superfamily n=1 Tax=Aspergillus avenaceus TaxID=36643 RepID=A0A5N6U7K2_ASPAV|nr:glycoside hydrolase superfamily [Aspergillus avenaceus]
MRLLSALALFIAPRIAGAISTGPLSTEGRWIVDSNGENVTFAGVNWPGAADAMLPEGLQYQSIEYIVSKIKSLGMNVVRLTFATEMIDDIYEKGSDTSIEDSLVNALGNDNGTAVYREIVKHNSQLGGNTTRLQVFDAVADECYRQGIYVHLDNHISKGMWCCDTNDGNSWFGDKYFDVENWYRGWRYMAEHVKSLPAVKSVGMRNELRSPDSNSDLVDKTYNWQYWYKHMVENANQIHDVNPDVLIYFSGLNYDTILTPIPTGADLGNGTKFLKDDFSYGDKIVLELHNYDRTATSCDDLKSGLWNGGFNALDTTNSSIVNTFPVQMTEFGFPQDNTTYTDVYASCLREWLPEIQAGWMVWVIAGSYYIREGVQDDEELWGLLDHTWSDWRSPAAINNGLKRMVEATLG